MADPWEQFMPTPAAPQAAPAANDPWAKFAASPAAPAPSSSADSSYLPWLSAFSNRAANAAALGMADPLHAGLSRFTNWAGLTSNAPDLATLQAQSRAERERLGWSGALPAEAMGYATGLGQLGIARNIASRLGEGLLARATGRAAEGATAGALGGMAEGQYSPDQSLLPQVAEKAGGGALTGGALGVVAGPLVEGGANLLGRMGTGAANLIGRMRGAFSTPGEISAATEATKKAAFDLPKAVTYDTAGTAKPAVDQLNSTLDTTIDPGGSLRQHAPQTMAEINKLNARVATPPSNIPPSQQAIIDNLQQQPPTPANQQLLAYYRQIYPPPVPKFPTQSADDYLTTINKLKGIRDSGKGPDSALASDVIPHLENFLATAPTTSGHMPAQVSQMIADARATQAPFRLAQNLQDWAQKVKSRGFNPASEAADQAETYYNPRTNPAPGQPSGTPRDEYNALMDIANAGGGYGGGISPWGMAHAVHPLIGAAVDAATPVGHLRTAAEAALTYAGVKPAASAAMKGLQKRQVLNAIAAAYPTLTPGYRVGFQAPDLSPAARALLFGQATAGYQ